MRLLSARDGLGRAAKKLRQGPCTMGYMGASIAGMRNGWRTAIHEWLNKHFPHSEPHLEVNCCVGGVGSIIGAFNARRNFTHHSPDLVFIEYSVVDFLRFAHRSAAPVEAEYSVEALVRIIKSINPECDICFIYYFCFGSEDHLRGRHTPTEKIYEEIADYYGIPSISAAQFFLNLSNSGEMHLTGENGLPAIYRSDMSHPTIEGNRRVVGFLCAQLAKLLAAKPTKRSAKLPTPLHPVRIEDWRCYPAQRHMFSGNIEIVEIPVGKKAGGERKKYAQYVALRAGGKVSFKVHGHLVAIFLIIGPDSGVVRCRVGDRVEVRNLFDSFCFHDRVTMFIPFHNPGIEGEPQTREVVFELLKSLPQDVQGLPPVQKPSKWKIGVVELRVVGQVLK
jgi:lysophospholipase L1-like esterase